MIDQKPWAWTLQNKVVHHPSPPMLTGSLTADTEVGAYQLGVAHLLRVIGWRDAENTRLKLQYEPATIVQHDPEREALIFSLANVLIAAGVDFDPETLIKVVDELGGRS